MESRYVAIIAAVTASVASVMVTLITSRATAAKAADGKSEGKAGAPPESKPESRQDKRLDALLAALRDPSLDTATRAELLRALARDHRSLGARLVHLVTNPTHWRMVWFGIGWMALLMAGMPLALHAAEAFRLHAYALPSLATIAMAGFAMITLPMAWRELTRRDRVAQQR